jgi:hypothetical protein
MKTLITILTIISCCIIIGCDSEVKITNPTLLTNPYEPYLYDTITNEIIADAEIDGDAVNIDSYDWLITDINGDSVRILSNNENIIKWIPLKLGVYTIEVTLTADNKSIKEINQINIEFSASSVQKYLTGDWKGKGYKSNGDEWIASFQIDNNKGHYSGSIDEIISGTVNSVVDDNSNDLIDHADKIIEVHLMENDTTFFGGYSFLPSAGNLWFSDLFNIRFKNDFNSLHFEPFNDGDTIYYDLERQ